ncbi:hypothetical protein BSKO_10294 [Bryopsis sp. KO-2023]|nr:hypothetical protein BSKO_10294 [Bryopsis sp. KO-2023]
MVLALCIGDLHIPHRASDLPPRFKELLQPGKIHHVLCPGNLCSREVLDYLKTVCSSIHFTKGDFDDLDAPEDKVVTIENFKIGLCHGHQVVPGGDVEALGILLRRMDVDILITGHTHKFQVEQFEDHLLMNPGSGTGAYSMFCESVVPSFALMDINGSKVDVYIYEMINGESKIRKMEFIKPSRGGSNPMPSATQANGGTHLAPPLESKPTPSVKPTPPSAPPEPEVTNTPAPETVSPAEKAEEKNPLPEASSGPPKIQTLASGTPMGPPVNGTENDAEKEDSDPPPIPKPDEFAEVTFGAIEDEI